MSQALLIVHFSSLDAYVWERGAEDGRRLAEALQVAFSSPGQLILTDFLFSLNFPVPSGCALFWQPDGTFLSALFRAKAV